MCTLDDSNSLLKVPPKRTFSNFLLAMNPSIFAALENIFPDTPVTVLLQSVWNG